MTFVSNHNITESKSQSLVQVKKLSKWNGNYDLINKKVISSEMIDIGYISTVENQFMTIIRNGRRGKPNMSFLLIMLESMIRKDYR